MIERFVFDSPVSIWLVLAVALIVWITVVVFEFRSTYKFKQARLLALTLIVVSTTAIALRPALRSEKEIAPLLVLTDNYSQEQVDSIARSVDVEMVSIVRSDQEKNKTRYVSINELTELRQRIAFVIGDGLPTAILRAESAPSYVYVPSQKNTGIMDLHIPDVTVGKPTRIVGTFQSSTNVSSLKLTGPGGTVDSTKVNSSTGIFELLIRPKQAGLFVYTLQGGTVNERVPIEVRAAKKLRMLVLQKFPTFETRQLKEYLGKQGHSVTLRNQVSKNTFRFEYVNAPSTPPTRLSTTTLNSFDLVLVSQETLEELPASEVTALDESIRKGLGAIIFFQSAPVKNAARKLFSSSLTAREVDTVSLTHFSWTKPLTAHTAPVQLGSKADAETVWGDSRENSIAGYERRGIGKVGFQFMDQTYQLMLEGKSDEYSLLWSTLLEETARRSRPATNVRIKSTPPFMVNEPLSVEAISNSEDLKVFYDDKEIPLRENELIDGVWTTTIWPTQPGWHHVTTHDSVSVAFFVFNPDEWQSLKKTRVQTENHQDHSTKTKRVLSGETTEPVRLVYFFIILLLAAGFLWLSPKL